MKEIILFCVLFGSMPLYAAESEAETVSETQTEAKPAEDKAIVKADVTAASTIEKDDSEKAVQKTVKQRKAGDFIPTESISEDLAVSFPIDI
ncbi:MAG: hypothetical protein ACI8WB_000293 [Phenylobacterium sp.]|jgi:hypothetical protein